MHPQALLVCFFGVCFGYTRATSLDKAANTESLNKIFSKTERASLKAEAVVPPWLRQTKAIRNAMDQATKDEGASLILSECKTLIEFRIEDEFIKEKCFVECLQDSVDDPNYDPKDFECSLVSGDIEARQEEHEPEKKVVITMAGAAATATLVSGVIKSVDTVSSWWR